MDAVGIDVLERLDTEEAVMDEQRIHCLQRLDIEVSIDAAEPSQHQVAERIRPLDHLGIVFVGRQQVRILLAHEGQHCVVGPEPDIPVWMQPAPGVEIALHHRRQIGGLPGEVQQFGDHGTLAGLERRA